MERLASAYGAARPGSGGRCKAAARGARQTRRPYAVLPIARCAAAQERLTDYNSLKEQSITNNALIASMKQARASASGRPIQATRRPPLSRREVRHRS